MPPRPPLPPARGSSLLFPTRRIDQSTIADTVSATLQKPRFPYFSGDEKDESSFESWKLEVNCILREKNFTESIVVQAVRMSLKGSARSLLLSLPETATSRQIVDKLEGVFGNVYSSESLLEKFYKQIQQPGQSIAEYGMLLESIIHPAVQKGELSLEAKNSHK